VYANAKVCDAAPPVFGVTETAEGEVPLEGTVQVPTWLQLPSTAALDTFVYTFLAPAYAGLKVTAKLTVRLFPDGFAIEAPASIMHWLFCNVPATCSGIGPSQVPVSLARKISLGFAT
jgi:hypothetical protein